MQFRTDEQLVDFFPFDLKRLTVELGPFSRHSLDHSSSYFPSRLDCKQSMLEPLFTHDFANLLVKGWCGLDDNSA